MSTVRERPEQGQRSERSVIPRGCDIPMLLARGIQCTVQSQHRFCATDVTRTAPGGAR